MAFEGIRNYFNHGALIATEDVAVSTVPSTNPTATTAKALVVSIGSWLSTVVAKFVPSFTDGTVLADVTGVFIRGFTTRPTATVTRPADTTAYASGDLVANSTTAGSVTPMSFTVSRGTATGGMVRRCRIRTSSTSITNATFRLHLYAASPTCTNGDNGAWLTDNATNYVGSLDVTIDKAFSDGAAGNGVPSVGNEINFTSTTYYGLLEARAAYTPTSGEVFTVELEVIQN
jgi:hypothetical protein